MQGLHSHLKCPLFQYQASSCSPLKKCFTLPSIFDPRLSVDRNPGRFLPSRSISTVPAERGQTERTPAQPQQCQSTSTNQPPQVRLLCPAAFLCDVVPISVSASPSSLLSLGAVSSIANCSQGNQSFHRIASHPTLLYSISRPALLRTANRSSCISMSLNLARQ